MDRDKQIDEMAKDLLNVSKKISNILMEETHEFLSQNHKYNSLKDFHEAHKKGRNVMEAEFLVELDYAKASEVAREIFEEIESKLILNKAIHCGQKFYYTRLEDDIAELKKKYTESEKDNGC